MIPFHKIYSWLFSSFSIGEETKIIEQLIKQGYEKIMIIKRSWIFILFFLWIPILILILSGISIVIAYMTIDVLSIKYTFIIANVMMSTILVLSSFFYIRHFRRIHPQASIANDPRKLLSDLKQGDEYFTRFFNWSLTNQLILSIGMVIELILILLHHEFLVDDFLYLGIDITILATEIFFLKKYRKRMIDLEMDFNIVVPGRLFLVNQTGILSKTQTIESTKIKTILSSFPNKLSSFFNFGNVDILTEGDANMIGAVTFYYITAPTKVVEHIEWLLHTPPPSIMTREENAKKSTDEKKGNHASKEISRRSLDTRERVRDVLR